MIKVVIGVLIAAVVVIVGFMILDPDIALTNNPETAEVSSSTQTGSTYTIEGEVNKPGSYIIDDAVTMKDLIAAAGGVTNNADDLAFYDEAPLTANSTYYIASKYDVSDVCTQNEIKKVNINTDDADTLMTVSGFTTSIATSIVSYRVANGTFQTIEQLTEVYGIGNATYRKVRNFVILHE